jgi:hypothetical protein
MRSLSSWLGLSAGLAFLFVGAFSGQETPAAQPFPDAHEAPPPGWTGRVFKLSAEYPTRPVPATNLPWMRIDFRTEPERYMMAVLDYCLEGQREADWVAQNNQVRKWFHAPWQHWGVYGREFINGMTTELAASPGKLGPNQNRTVINAAIGFYNDVAAYEFGRVWADPMNPQINNIRFPDGSVAFKLLHVNATDEELPFLKGSPTREGYLPVDPGGVAPDGSLIPPSARRAVETVKLLQIDIAIREARNNDLTGWVFGTFVYDGNRPGTDPWKKLVPVGLSWGNDPGITPLNSDGGKALKQQWINPDMRLFEWRQSPGMGWAGRLNGPLDNPESSCMSCHSTAQVNNPANLAPGNFANNAERMRWFQNVKAGEAFNPPGQSTDYSLQLAGGIASFIQWLEVTKTQRSPEGLSQADEKVIPRRFTNNQ